LKNNRIETVPAIISEIDTLKVLLLQKNPLCKELRELMDALSYKTVGEEYENHMWKAHTFDGPTKALQAYFRDQKQLGDKSLIQFETTILTI
jgi:hypothetical protein